MRRGPDWLAHAILGLGVLLFALPVWLVLAGSTQDSAAIARGELSLWPGADGLAAYARAWHGGAPRSPHSVSQSGFANRESRYCACWIA